MTKNHILTIHHQSFFPFPIPFFPSFFPSPPFFRPCPRISKCPALAPNICSVFAVNCPLNFLFIFACARSLAFLGFIVRLPFFVTLLGLDDFDVEGLDFIGP
jgi:hypothetical protein